MYLEYVWIVLKKMNLAIKSTYSPCLYLNRTILVIILSSRLTSRTQKFRTETGYKGKMYTFIYKFFLSPLLGLPTSEHGL